MARILVVDDERAVREMLQDALVRDGHAVLCAADGDEAIDLFGSGGIDIVIMDLIMPVREGLETILELQRLEPSVAVIAISGGGQIAAATYLGMARNLGARATLAKPIGLKELRAAVASLSSGELTST